MPIAIMSAMLEEIEMLLPELGPDAEKRTRGQRDYYLGELAGQEVVLVFSRWGKVAAAATVAHLIAEFGIKSLLFSGVAGALAPGLKVGDLVVGETFVQHDLDASPLFKRYETPLLGLSHFPADAEITERLTKAARDFVEKDLATQVGAESLQRFGLGEPTIHRGLIVSGDRFIASHAAAQDLRERVEGALCVEMEGAAVAQVCFEYGLPFGLLRVLSDGADDSAPVDFLAFIAEVARHYAHGVMLRTLADL
ncbi:MAG: 5'-methylthioadenosine/adenosylhomocysteine nucleosidase [Rhodospirillales bacterium]